MSHRPWDGRDAARPSPLRRRGVAPVIAALAAAVAFGALDQYLGALRSSFLTSVSGMSAPWLLVPFLAGAWQATQRRALMVGLAATLLAVLAYVVMIVSPMEGTHLGPRPAAMAGHPGTWNQLTPNLFLATLVSQWLWFAGGLIAGPLCGWLGYRWRAYRSGRAALLVALAVTLEPLVRWLAARFGQAYIGWLAFQGPGYGPASIAEIALGLALTAAVATTMLRARATRNTQPVP
jgi:hypothetical protein